jgi:predicted nucleic acid-binding protein
VKPARVVDASVLAARCFREPRAAEALARLQDSDLYYAPTLLAYELISIARKKAAADPQKLAVLTEALQIALALPIRWIELDHTAVLRLAVAVNLTTFDACYLYLARLLGASLATFDQRLAHAARNLG